MAQGTSASDGLVFVRVVDGSKDLLRLRVADGAERPITATPRREETWPYWSDAAQRLVFQVSAGGRDSDLVLWSPQGGESPLTDTPARQERWPTWAPHGATLAWAFVGGSPPAGLTLFDIASGEPRLLARTGLHDFFFRPAFSPGGELLVAQRRSQDGRGSDLWLRGPGAVMRPLTSDPDFKDIKPFFSRDGGSVFFTRGPTAGGPRDVARIATSGGAVRIVAGDPNADEHSGRPSPTRDELAFVSDRDGRPRVYLSDLGGGNVRPLGPGDRSAFGPRWSPDGERLVVTTSETGTPRLAERESLEGSRLTVLDRTGRVLAETAGLMPDWMPPWP